MHAYARACTLAPRRALALRPFLARTRTTHVPAHRVWMHTRTHICRCCSRVRWRSWLQHARCACVIGQIAPLKPPGARPRMTLRCGGESSLQDGIYSLITCRPFHVRPLLSARSLAYILRIRTRSFWTHAWGLAMALLGTALMLLKSKTIMSLTASGIYGGCMCLLFFASSLHHTVKRPASIQAHLPAYFRESESEKRARERERARARERERVCLSVFVCARVRARARARVRVMHPTG